MLQVTSDQGSGLLNHVKKGLGVHQSPDIFHISYEIGKGTSGPLVSKIRRAEQALLTEKKQIEKINSKMHCYDDNKCRPRGRRPYFEKNLNLAEKELEHAETDLQKARERQETVRVERKKDRSRLSPLRSINWKKTRCFNSGDPS